MDTLLTEANARGVESGPYALAVSDGAYTTNVPVADLIGGRGMIVTRYEGLPIQPVHVASN